MIGRKSIVIMEKSKMSADSVFEKFISEKQSNNLSEETIKLYKMHVKYFFEVLAVEKGDTLYALTSEDIRFFKQTILLEKNDITSASYCRSIRAFVFWCRDNGYLEDRNIRFQIPKVQQRVKATYTDEELKALLKNPLPCTMTEYQSFVFINLTISTGLRLASLLDLKVSNYNKSEGYITVNKTKNRLAQTRYLNSSMVDILNTYIDKFELEDSDYLFCNQSGNRASRRTVQGQIERYNKKRGVNKTSIHLFRHTYAKNFVKNGGSVRDLQMILDHANISTTENYLRDLGLDSQATREVFNPQRQFGKASNRYTKNRRSIIE